jgi:hypothetical protein
MAATGPICIMTPDGLRCLSSPLKQHVPGRRPCEEIEIDKELRDDLSEEAVERWVASLPRMPSLTDDGRRVLSNCVKLLLLKSVNLEGPLTLVKMSGCEDVDRVEQR